MNKAAKILVVLVLIGGVAGIAYANNFVNKSLEYKADPNASTTQAVIVPDATEKEVSKIMDEDEFKQKIHDEAMREFYKREADEIERQKEVNKQHLLDLQNRGFNAPAHLQSYLRAKGSSLAGHAEDITRLPRWVEALAIAGHETQFCKTGVGATQNNCGGIKGSKGGFARYSSSFEGLKAISDWLVAHPKEVTEYNGFYCVNEKVGSGECPNWSEHIEQFINEILVA